MQTKYALETTQYAMPDPGNAGVLPHSNLGCVALKTAGAETRTLPNPSRAGLWLLLSMKEYGGNCVVTTASAYDETGGTTLTFSEIGQFALLFAVETAPATYAWRVVGYDGVTGPTTKATALNLTTLSIGGTTVTATAAELNRAADASESVVVCTASTLGVTEALHNKRTIVLDRAAGIAVTLPAAAAGLEFEFIVKTTFTGAASIKSATGADIMIGHAIMGNDSDDTIVNFQSVAGSTNDTIDLFGTSNSTGGMAGQRIKIKGLAANLWYVEIIGDAAGTEATPFADTVT